VGSVTSSRPCSKDYFTLWVAISIAWGIVATIVIIVMPLWESWDGICLVVKGLLTNDDVHMRMDEIEVGSNSR